YWLKLFSSGIPRLENFTDFPRPTVQEFTGDLIVMDFDEDLTQRLNRSARTAGATLYMVLLAVYNVLLFKYTGCRDIVVGTPVAGREQPEVENVVGLFINALVMRNYPAPDKTFTQFLEEVKMNTAAAFENQAYPFGDLMEKLNVKSDISRNPIFDVELIVQNMDLSLPAAQEIRLRAYPFEVKVAQVDAALYVMEYGGKLHFRCIYSSGLFKRTTMERFMVHFKEIVSRVLEKRDICLQDIVLSHNLEKVKADAYAEMASDLGF
ncbi:MAG: condensation domain-containing protein, partial [Candidatus Aminicenantes bacterium]|nr:condensation domain-containing protein [Candidatus Aminicenantes bacterium]